MIDDNIVMVACRRVPVAPRGNRMGEHAHACKYPDAVVAAARALRRDGSTYPEISAQLGVKICTLETWIHGVTRNPPARYVLVPIEA